MGTPAKSPVAVKSQKGTCWFLRSDGSEEFLRQKCGVLATWIDVKAVLAVYHVGGTKENPHCHAVVETTSEIQKQSFDKKIKALFGIEKKSQYSTKLWDGVRDAGASSYMFHEKDAPILVRKGWTDDELATAKATCETVQKVVAMNKERASTKLVDKALDHFQGKDPSRFEILEWMLMECRDGGSYYPGTFLLKKHVEEVLLKLTTKTNFVYFVQQLESQMWKDNF